MAVVAEAQTVKNKGIMHNDKKGNIEVQGHRGERGHLPENTIPAFLGAVEFGVNVLELDVVISKDGKVVVSHEPFMSALYVSTPIGSPITKETEKSYNLFTMDYDSIKMFDTGSRGNKNFPQQRKMKTHKPLLAEVFDAVEEKIAKSALKSVHYNIEIKSEPQEYDISQLQPKAFVDLVMQVIAEKDMEKQINIQSFDPEILEVMHRNYPDIDLAFLVGDKSLDENMKALTFTPQIYSPHFKLITDTAMVNAVHKKQMKLIPWTVNTPEDIVFMVSLKVDGIISDYPDRVLEILK
jgi:glycerophosphoryl diester phosphodiesterase